eukprot:9470142-Pyramimonas_sp.AAC.1
MSGLSPNRGILEEKQEIVHKYPQMVKKIIENSQQQRLHGQKRFRAKIAPRRLFGLFWGIPPVEGQARLKPGRRTAPRAAARTRGACTAGRPR